MQWIFLPILCLTFGKKSLSALDFLLIFKTTLENELGKNFDMTDFYINTEDERAQKREKELRRMKLNLAKEDEELLKRR